MQPRSTLPKNALRVSTVAGAMQAQPHTARPISGHGRAFLLVNGEPAAPGDDEMFAIPLVARSGAGAGRAAGVITIGRLEHNDVFLGDDSVSTLHAIIHQRGGEFFIADAGSTLGTHVDGEPAGRLIDHAERRLTGGATLQLGNVSVMFVDAEGLLAVADALHSG